MGYASHTRHKCIQHSGRSCHWFFFFFFFQLICLIPTPHCRAPWDTRINPPTLPTPLISSFDGSLCCPAAGPPWRRGHWIPRQRGKAIALPSLSPLPQNWPMKRGSRRKKAKTGAKKVGERERLYGQPELNKEGEGSCTWKENMHFYLLPGANPSWGVET